MGAPFVTTGRSEILRVESTGWTINVEPIAEHLQIQPSLRPTPSQAFSTFE
jgi:hypothetical protein